DFKNFVLSKQTEFTSYIKNNIYIDFEFKKWYENSINRADSDVNRMEQAINLSLNQLSDFEKSTDLGDSDLSRIESQRSQIEKTKIINVLSRYNVLPSYSFP